MQMMMWMNIVDGDVDEYVDVVVVYCGGDEDEKDYKRNNDDNDKKMKCSHSNCHLVKNEYSSQKLYF